MPLTDIAIKKAKPGSKRYKLSDEKGLYLLIDPSGGKWWRLKFRINGKEDSLSFGVYPETSLASARQQRDQARTLIKSGINPKAKTAKPAAEGSSFKEVALEYLGKRANRLTPRYHAEIVRRMELNIFPDLGDQPIDAITAPGLLAVIREIEARGAYELSHRLLQVCSQVFRYGVATGKCQRDIAADLRGALTPHQPRKMPAVKPEELPALWAAIGRHKGEEQVRIGLQLLAMLFVRTSELRLARWPEIDFKNALWTIPEGRMKKRREHLVPLSPEAVALLQRLHELNGRGEYLFPGRNALEPISNNTFLTALYRLGYRGRQSGHGFRAVARTTIKEQRSLGNHAFSQDAVRIQLSHKNKDKTDDAYDRSELLPERRQLMAWWSAFLAKLDQVSSGK